MDSKHSHPQLIGPVLTWRAERDHVLEIEAAYSGGAGSTEVRWRRARQRRFSSAPPLRFNPVRDGEFHDYRLYLGREEHYADTLCQLRLDVGNDGNAAKQSSVRVRSIRVVSAKDVIENK